MRYRVSTTVFLFVAVLGCAGILLGTPTRASAATYYIAANGNDSNNGTSKTTPWLHAPGMPNCTGICATITPQAGSNFIFRGGDTWHFGNPNAVPYTGIRASGNGSGCDAGNSCGWSIGGPSNAWSGTPSSPIYFGVDQTWYNASVCGGSWCRPIMNGDNPVSASSVSSCAYDQRGFSFLQSWTGSSNYIIDDFEWTGLCWGGANQNPTYVSIGNHFSNSTTNRTIENNYFHGWTHLAFNCSLGSNGEPVGNCNGGQAVSGPSDSTAGIGDTVTHNVFDGSDTDQKSFSGILFGAYVVEDNVFNDIASGAVLNNNHVWDNNLEENIYGYSDGVAHGNGIEMNTEYNTVNVFYDNIFRNFFPGGVGCGNVQVWTTPQTTDYEFNNLAYSFNCSSAGNYWDMPNASQGGANGWTADVFNNTWVMPSGANSNSANTTVNWYNNHCIVPGGGSAANCFSGGGGTLNYLTNVVQDPSVASAQGYTSGETYAYSPTSNTGATVGAGTNEKTYCNTLSASNDLWLQAAGAACKSDTGYSCAYNSSNHTVSCPARTVVSRPSSGAWDAGAYQYSSSGGQNNPPQITSSLSANGTVNQSFSYQITATNNPTSYAATNLPAGLSVNTATGIIGGTPTQTGTTNVTISATNPYGTGSATLVVTVSSNGGGGTATLQNWDNSPVIGFPDGGEPPASNTVSLTANIASAGDLVVVTAWCFPSTFNGSGCTPVSVTLGNQTAVRTSVAGQLDQGTAGTPGSGIGWIYYVLSANSAGQQTITFRTVETQQLQVSYMDFKPSAGATFSHDIDSPLGGNFISGQGGTAINSPSYTPSQGDLLFNFTMTSSHMVDPVGSPWTPVIWQPQMSHFLENSVNLVAYDASAPGGTVANNANTLHMGDTWQALLTSFKINAGGGQNNPPQITSSLSANGTVNQSFSYQITATNNPTSYAATNLPAGLSVNTATGLIGGTPTQTGTTNVTISATNPYGTGSATLVVTVSSSGDNQPPTTSITYPTNNQTVSSTITVTATASDNVGVTRVEFYLDGVLQTTDTASPYTWSWNTTTAASGSHTLQTKAYDAAGNVGTSPTVSVIVSNAIGASPAFIQLVENDVTGSGSTITTGNFTSSVHQGDLILAWIWYNSTSQSVSSVADTKGDAYVRAIGPTTGTGSLAGWRQELWYAKNVAGGSGVSVTATFTGSFTGEKAISTHEYANLDATAPLDQVSATAVNGANVSTPTMTTTAANELIFGAALFATTGSSGSGFTQRSSLAGNATEDKDVSSIGSYAASFVNSAQNVVAQMATFKAAGTGGGGQNNPPQITSSLSANGTVNQSFSYQITATNNPTSYAATNLPAGLSVNTATGLIGGTPTQTGTTNVTISATNPYGTGSATLVVTVVNNSSVYPLKMSANGRYLVNKNNVPFLLVGDSPQSLIGEVSESQADAYFADRASHGFNAAWINLLCDTYTFCGSNGQTYDGIAPFTSGNSPSNYDLSTPNPAYFQRVDDMINLAANHGIVVFLDPIETGGWLPTLENNGATKDYNYGVYLGNRYKNFTNIVWMSGNDFQTWTNQTDNADATAVIQGIESVDANHLQTAELDYNVSASFDDTTMAPHLSLNAAYTYYATYAEVLHAYNQSTDPAFMVEAHYEGENVVAVTLAPEMFFRRQEYWTLLSGATGQLYGSTYTDRIANGWLQSNLDSVGVTQLQYVTQLFANLPWYTLVPDQNHVLVTAGYGTFSASEQSSQNDYLTDAETPDHTLAIAYMPTVRTFTVNMAQFAGLVTASWYDPTTGTSSTISGSPFANTGTRQFTPSGNNHGGDQDWVIVFKVQGGQNNPPQITSSLSANGTVNQSFSYQITATNNPTSYAATNLPAGLSVNTATGLIGGTPTQTGTTNVTISATNPYGTGSATLVVTVVSGVVIPPSVPTNLTKTGATTSSIAFTWSASNPGTYPIAGYYVFRNASQVGSVSSPGFTDTGLTPSTTYSYIVNAFDTMNNISSSSLPLAISTLSISNSTTTPTSTPQIISFTASPGTINQGQASTLAWLTNGNPAPVLTITPDIGQVAGSSVPVTPSQTTTYTLTAQNSYGQATAQTTVTVQTSGGGGGGGGGSSGGGGFSGGTSSGTGTSSSSTSSLESLLLSLLAELKSLIVKLNAQLVTSFTRSLTIGSTGQDVKDLQIFLNDNGDSIVQTGPGSPGQESTYFGAKTAQALAKWQKANGLPATGYLGPMTRAYMTSTW